MLGRKIVLFLTIGVILTGCAKKNEVTEPVAESVEFPEEAALEEVASDKKETSAEPAESSEIKLYEYYRINSPEGLRLRDSASLDSKVIKTYPDNLPVRVNAIDDSIVEIDGISSHWVQVYHNTDPYGWVFGGYLKPMEKVPEDALGVNEYRYTDYKTSYGDLRPSDLDENWEAFYIFSKDYVGESQQFELEIYDMFTSIDYDNYKIFTGLYKDKNGTEGYFIVKTDLAEKKVLQKFVQETGDHLIVFLKPWDSVSPYMSVGRWFESEATFYISRDNIEEKLYWSD
ncbi:MAG: SH3 domain-containing protein [Treponema sp.]|nr:SH3 domain-containing protein [Treponema sp.]